MSTDVPHACPVTFVDEIVTIAKALRLVKGVVIEVKLEIIGSMEHEDKTSNR